MLDKHANAFKEEANELLVVLENSLLELGENSTNDELIGQVFRALHTIKGSSGMFGFNNIADFVHTIENVFDKVREGKIPITQQLIDITLSAKDQIGLMLKEMDGNSISDKNKTDEISAVFKTFITEKDSENKTKNITSGNAVLENNITGKKCSYYVLFKPAKEILLSGTNPLALLNEIRELGNCMILANVDQVPTLENFNPEYCYTYWNIIISTDKGKNAIKDVFIFVEDEAEVKIDLLSEDDILSNPENSDKLKKFLTGHKDFSVKNLKDLLNGKNLSIPVHNNNKVQGNNSRDSKPRPENGTMASIRVSSDKLDTLVNLVGELVTIQASLTQASNKKKDQEFLAIAETIERLTWELRDNALNIRMIPIGTTFNKFKRLVHDLSKELGKEVELATDGAETELDKNVIERLSDPLIHIVRNCIDHGIESPEVRKSAGKSLTGTVHLSAKHSGTHVLIKISDDGAGLNKEAILAKAVEKNMVPAGKELSDKEAFQFILKPGFSTSKVITNISGRGVGMDVVQKTIESLRGSVEIASEFGRGTTFTLKLPLTLAIIEGLIVRVAADYFVIPLSSIEECIEFTKNDFNSMTMVNIRGELVPYINLREKFEIYGDIPDIEQIVIVKDNDVKVGFTVDEIIGQHQTVIKSLGTFYKKVEAVSGATVLGDGTVALILDVLKLIHASFDEEFDETHKILNYN
jgi:two-component system chemotaxis sensor kinase CheA